MGLDIFIVCWHSHSRHYDDSDMAYAAALMHRSADTYMSCVPYQELPGLLFIPDQGSHCLAFAQ